MTKLSISLIGIITLGITFPAVAGPDFQAIEQARKARQSIESTALHDVKAKGCEFRKFAPQVDHGPRAQSTPYLNQQRKLQFEAVVADRTKLIAD